LLGRFRQLDQVGPGNLVQNFSEFNLLRPPTTRTMNNDCKLLEYSQYSISNRYTYYPKVMT